MPSGKQKIIISSVLKPVNDVRSYHKIGLSLIPHFKEAELHIIGYQASEEMKTHVEGVYFYPLFSFSRLSVPRLFVSLQFFFLLLKLKPSLIICTSYELLGSTVLTKLFFRTKVIYDVQEDYFKNIYYASTLPSFIRKPLAYFIRSKEILWSWFVDHFFVAEKVYLEDVPFLKENATLLENKAIQPEVVNEDKKRGLHFLISGTLTKSFGILEGIAFAKKMHEIDDSVRLTVIGHVPDSSFYQELLNLNNCSFIDLQLSLQPITYPEITKAYHKADYLLLPYQWQPHTQGKIPTKLYDGLAHQIPMIIQENELLTSLMTEYDTTLFINYLSVNERECMQRLKEKTFYSKNVNKCFWDSEEIKLRTIVSQLIY
ncbi:MAG: hypothetical protein AB8B61_03510 [Cyclobacteriaceae bacterium]